MTNQDTNDPQQVHAHLGLIRIPNNCCENWLEYTPEAARALIGDIAIAHKEALRQLAAIVEACANGHDWNTGFNRTWGEKATIRHCERPGCEAQDEQPGWLPFEPKTHRVPDYLTMRMVDADCTGPGCEHCSAEATARVMDAMFDNIKIKLHNDLWANTAKSQPPADATPEQVQAALDARNGES